MQESNGPTTKTGVNSCYGLTNPFCQEPDLIHRKSTPSNILPHARPYLRAVERRVLALDCAVSFDDASAEGVTIAAFIDLNAAFLAEVAPELVVLPLFSVGQDATTMVEALMNLGYDGAISVMAPRLPDRAMVERELRALGPGLRLRLVAPKAH